MRHGWALAAALVAVGARAEASPTVHERWFGRLTLGAGYSVGSEDSPVGTFRLTGFGPSTEVALGWHVVPNLAVHLTLWGAAMVRPTLSADSLSAGSAGYTSTIYTGAMGVGVTYWFTRWDLYASASIGVGSVTVGGTSAQSLNDVSPGLGLCATVGRQWSLGASWGVGVGAQLQVVSVTDHATITAAGVIVRALDEPVLFVQAGVVGALTYD